MATTLPQDVVGAEGLERSVQSMDTCVSLNRLEDLQRAGFYPRNLERPLGFQLELTSKCNLYCKHCYNASGGRGRTDLPREDWDRIVEQVAAMEPLQVILSGGEPLMLGERLFRIMDRLSQGPTRFVLITNGWLANEKTVERLCRYNYYWMQVSIDGFTPEAHDEFRQRQGSWERAVRAAFEISKRSQPLVIAHTVHPGNIDTLDQMVDLASILGATRIVCDEAMQVGRAWSERDRISLTPEQRARMGDIIYAKQQEYEQSMEVLRSCDPANSFALYLALPCSVLLIRPNGDVKLDCVLPYVIGNLARQSLEEIWETVGRDAWRHPRVQEFVKKYQSSGDFAVCEARPYVQQDVLLDARP